MKLSHESIAPPTRKSAFNELGLKATIDLLCEEVREGYIHSHGIALQALGKARNALLKQYPGEWKFKLASLEKIDWSRQNAGLWEGRALIGGKVSKVTTSIILTTNVVKRFLDLKLSEDESSVEEAHTRV